MSGQTEAMRRRASTTCRKLHNGDRIQNLVDVAIVTNPPHPKIHGSYNRDRETSSEDELSGPEFGGNYRISKALPWSRPYGHYDDYSVRSLTTPEDQHRVARPQLQRQIPRAHKNRHIAAAGESTNLPVLQETQLASQKTIEPLETNTLPESPIFRAPRACLDAGQGTQPPDSKGETICKPGTELNRPAAAPPDSLKNFTSQCSIRQKCHGTRDSSEKDLAAEQTSLTRPGPVVNHYPQPKRRRDVKCAIDGVDDVFELSKASKVPRPVGSTGTKLRRRLTVEANDSAQYSSLSENSRPSSSASRSSALDHGTAKNKHDYLVDGFVHIIGEDYLNSEPVDGGHDGWQSSGTPSATVPTAGRSQGGTTRNGSGGSGKRNRSNSCDRRNPQTPPTKKPFPSAANDGFPCVYHNPTDPDNDETFDCKTRHQYVSQLRIHHGGYTHAFYYCTNCFVTFPNKTERDAHTRSRCRDFKCVTEECPNFDTFEVSTCDHPTSKNSQEAVWRALFRLARPDDPIPSEFGDRLAALSPGAGPSSSSLRTDARPSSSNMASTPRRPGQFNSTQSSGASLPTRGSLVRETNESDPCYLGLRALTRALVAQLDIPDPEGLEVLRRMYPSYMDHGLQNVPNQDAHNASPGTIQGLRTLNEMLWGVVQNPEEASPNRVQHLRAWVDDILPKQNSHLTSTETSPSARYNPQQPLQQPVTPTPLAAEPSRDGHPRAHSVPVSNLLPDSHGYNQSFNPLMFGQLPELDLDIYGQPIDTGPSSFSNVPQQFPAQFPELAPSFLPFTQGDSAEAFPQDGRAVSKTRTRDSGYGTGRTNNSS